MVEVRHRSVAWHLEALRDPATPSAGFRRHLHDMSRFLVYEATASLWPVTTTGSERGALVVPVLRAGLGLLEGALELVPDAEVGFLGLRRDEVTLEPSLYWSRLPADLSGRPVLVLDPMLATGGTLAAVVGILAERGATGIVAVTVLTTPEGLARVEKEASRLSVVCASVDERLDRHGFIVPGMGDAGDRLFGPS